MGGEIPPLQCKCKCKMQMFWKKNSQVHLIIIREWPKNSSPVLRNLDNSPPPGAFYSTPSTIRHKRVLSTSSSSIPLYFHE